MTCNLCPRRCRRPGIRAGAVRSQFFQPDRKSGRRILVLALASAVLPACRASEGPFFITYTHQMEEPGNLEFATRNVVGKPDGGRRFLGTAAELEYGIKGWW